MQLVDIAKISKICAHMHYQTPSTNRTDHTVRRISKTVSRTLPSNNIEASCMESVNELSCSLVFPSTKLPHFSDMLLGVSGSCQISVEDISDRLLHNMKHPGESYLDVGSAVVFLFVIWYFGYWLVRRWCREMVDAYEQLGQPVKNSQQESCIITIPDDSIEEAKV